MTVRDLMKELKKHNPDSIVVLTDRDGIGWDNVGEIVEISGQLELRDDGNRSETPTT
jgi:hypothetical protein